MGRRRGNDGAPSDLEFGLNERNPLGKSTSQLWRVFEGALARVPDPADSRNELSVADHHGLVDGLRVGLRDFRVERADVTYPLGNVSHPNFVHQAAVISDRNECLASFLRSGATQNLSDDDTASKIETLQFP